MAPDLAPGTPAVWIWQRMVSPHMADLAAGLARRGGTAVYVAEQSLSAERAGDGWTVPDLGGARLRLAPDAAAMRALVAEAPPDSIHVCQGVRANGLIGVAQRALAARGLRQWVVMETVEDPGWKGALKRLEYARLFRRWRGRLEGVLATGHRTPAWVAGRGVPAAQVFPFAYFLPTPSVPAPVAPRTGPFRFLFVGRLIELKRLDLLIAALAAAGSRELELVVVGAGPLEAAWRAEAEAALPGRVRWVGRLPVTAVPAAMAEADCLVLPSRHDGWGAVVSEALMVGTPAICSDACGAAGAVHASTVGGVFRSGDRSGLQALVQAALERGRVAPGDRTRLARWARSLGGDAGACYLVEILAHRAGGGPRPPPPWEAGLT